MTRDLNILIGNLGKIDNLRACLRSLYETTGMNVSFKVFVGFNFSGESDAPLKLQGEFPDVEVLRAQGKLGYCRHINSLLERARDARYVLFLDDDTLLRPGAIETMVRFMDEHAEVGVAGCRTVNPDGSYQKSTALMFDVRTELLNAVRPAAFWSDGIDETVREWRSVAWLNGHFLMARVAAIETVGPLDENYYSFQCEADWCLRMRRAGWDIAYVPQAEVMHIGGQHSIMTKVKSYENLMRSNINRYYFFRKHYGPLEFLGLRLALGLGFVLRLSRYAATWALDRRRRSEAGPKVKAYFHLMLRAIGARPERLPAKLRKENEFTASLGYAPNPMALNQA